MLPRILLIAILVLVAVMVARGQTSERITYDNNGRIATVTYLQGNQALKIRYDYDGRGNVTRTRSEIVVGVADDAPSTGAVVSVYPNPTSHRVVIEAPVQLSAEAVFSVRAADGTMVLQEKVLANASGIARLEFEAATYALASGTYHVGITCAGTTTAASFVLTR